MPRTPAPLSIVPIESSQPHYLPTKSSKLRVPSSPTSPRTPLQPPARLHLRPLLTSPLRPNFLHFLPDSPYPWVWRCHICHTVYRLGVTRRCLEDGHYFCSFTNRNEGPSVPDLSDAGMISLEELVEKAKAARKSRKQRAKRSCRTEFDYLRWARYNIWRREVKTMKDEERGDSFSETSNDGQADCWTECDFPSECHNTRLERLRAVRQAVEETRSQPTININTQLWALSEENAEIEAQIDAMFDDGPPIDLLASPPSPEEEALETERRGVLGEATLVEASAIHIEDMDLVMPDAGANDFGMKEVEFVQNKRKKSIQKIRQLTGLELPREGAVSESQPPSPLKMQFSPEDLEDADVLQNTTTTDPQMQEVLKSKSDYLRLQTTINNDEESFGDEAMMI